MSTIDEQPEPAATFFMAGEAWHAIERSVGSEVETATSVVDTAVSTPTLTSMTSGRHARKQSEKSNSENEGSPCSP